MLQPLPYQPITFESDVVDCAAECSPAGFANLVQAGDVTQFQLRVGICEGSEQLLENNDWSNALTDWELIAGGLADPTVNGLQVVGEIDLQQTGLTNSTSYYGQIVVADLQGGFVQVRIGANPNSQFNIYQSGEYEFWIQSSSTILTISTFATGVEDVECTIPFINLFEGVVTSDIDVELIDGDGNVVADMGFILSILNGIVTVKVNWEAVGLLDGYVIDPIDFGTYRIRITHCDEEIISNEFVYGTETVGCDGFQTNTISACMDSSDGNGLQFQGFAPFVRLISTLGYARFGYERTRYRNSNGRITNYFAKGEKREELRLARLPSYMIDFIGSLPAYNNVYINGIEYSVESDSVDPIYDDDSPLAGTVVLEVAKRTQTLRMVKCAAPEKSCSPPPNCWEWNVGGAILWNDNECILLNN